MSSTLLYKESPNLGIFFTAIPLILYKRQSKYTSFSMIILICLILFYRYQSLNNVVENNIIISPAQGVITNLKKIKSNYYISIFLLVFNKHYQVYPINGVVVDRVYDKTGKFSLVINGSKSKENEKKIHTIETPYGNVVLTQIAGFLPRRINSSDKINEVVKAGQYLGIIKFGSRVDLLFPAENFDLNVKRGQQINIGDIIGKYNTDKINEKNITL